MKVFSKLSIQISVCIFLTATLGFGAHVLIQSFTKPILSAMSQSMQSTSDNYPPYIVLAAYLTAFIMISVQVIIYYFAGHLLSISNKILKSLVLAALLLESKGELIRYTFVGYLNLSRLGAHQPLFYILINQADVWIPNLILAFCLVYLCPLKSKPEVTKMVKQNSLATIFDK